MSSSTLLRALRRRGWILVVSVAAVSALALLIASTRPGDYSAQTVLLVPSSFGGQTPGNSDQATTLAGTYADLIGRDAALAGALGARLGIPTTSVGRHLRVHQHADSALLTVSYVGDYCDDARRGAAAGRDLPRRRPGQLEHRPERGAARASGDGRAAARRRPLVGPGVVGGQLRGGSVEPGQRRRRRAAGPQLRERAAQRRRAPRRDRP